MVINLDHPDLVEVERELCKETSPIVFFVGAGLSKPLGFPLWHEFLFQVIDFGQNIERLSIEQTEMAKDLVKENHYLECGQFLRERLGERVNEKLYQIFSGRILDDFGMYNYLVKLPCAGYITTNYDTLIETAYTKLNGSPLRIMSPDLPKTLGNISNNERFLLKLHGDVSTRNFIFSSEDYNTLEKDERLIRFLYSIFLRYKVVFLGYGLSDHDILVPLKLLAKDYESNLNRHVALLPHSISEQLRLELEDKTLINVVTYALDEAHDSIERVVLNWLIKNEKATNKNILFAGPQNCEKLLRRHSPIISHYLRNTIEGYFHWLNAVPTKWGLMPTTEPRAANIAEALISFHAAKRVLNTYVDCQGWVNDLLKFQNKDGGFMSVNFGVSTAHVTALSIYALSFYEDIGQYVVNANQRASDWLLQNIISNKGGWGKFGSLGSVRIIPTIWSYVALNRIEKLNVADWYKFRDALIEADGIGFFLGDSSKSNTATGWLIWLLSFLRQTPIWDMRDERLLDKSLQQLLDFRGRYSVELESFQLDKDEQASIQSTRRWIRWFHPTASSIALGATCWLSSKENTWTLLGKAVSFFLDKDNQANDGHVKDSVIENKDGIPFVFPTLYGMWALCDVYQYISGVIIEKVGLLVIRDKKLLLQRKRGTNQLIVPGGKCEADETLQMALSREIREELGAKVKNIRYWKTFEDAAAFERGATIRIASFMGELLDEPQPKAEIVEIVWVDTTYSNEKLSPIVRKKIIPELLKVGLIN